MRPTHRQGLAIPVARRYLPRPAGVLYVGITFLLLLGAINSQNNLLFWAFGIAVAGILVSGIVSGGGLMGLELTIDPIDPVHAGQPLHICLSLTNRSRLFPCFALVVEAEGSTPTKLIAPKPTLVEHLGPRRSARVTVLADTWNAGSSTLHRVRVSSTFPFGLMRKSIVFEQHVGIVIRPWIAPVRADILDDAGAPRPIGQQPMRRRGQGDEFFSLRDLRPGEGTRRIAWRATARLDRPVVRETLADRTPILWIGLDPTGESPDTQRSLSLAAGVIDRASKQGYRVGLTVPVGSHGAIVPPNTGVPHAERLYDVLARYESLKDKQTSTRIHPAPTDHVLWISPTRHTRFPTIDPTSNDALEVPGWANAPSPPPTHPVRSMRSFPAWLRGITRRFRFGRSA
ncbi:MAG: DUF58 domain-containing protein [Phycisphaerales bacterium]